MICTHTSRMKCENINNHQVEHIRFDSSHSSLAASHPFLITVFRWQIWHERVRTNKFITHNHSYRFVQINNSDRIQHDAHCTYFDVIRCSMLWNCVDGFFFPRVSLFSDLFLYVLFQFPLYSNVNFPAVFGVP